MFFTRVALSVDLKPGKRDYRNAGPEPPLLVGGPGDLRALNDGGGPPICVVPDFPYAIARDACAPGDIIVLTSDGITEAMDPGGGLYGRDRLQALLRSPAIFASDVAAIGSALLADVQSFEAGTEPADDQTLVVVRWRGEQRSNER